jgi:hypothetical protein
LKSVHYKKEKGGDLMEDLKTKIEMYIDHLKKLEVLEETPTKIRIFADRLVFGTATKEHNHKKGIVFILQSDVAKIELVHVLESKELLTKLRNTINTLLKEESSVEIV